MAHDRQALILIVDDEAPMITSLTATGGVVDTACEYRVPFSFTVTDDCCIMTNHITHGLK